MGGPVPSGNWREYEKPIPPGNFTQISQKHGQHSQPKKLQALTNLKYFKVNMTNTPLGTIRKNLKF